MTRENSNSPPILVKDIMTKELISVNLTTPAFQIAKMMELAEIGTVLVKENEAHVGIITDRDLQQKLLQITFHLILQLKK